MARQSYGSGSLILRGKTWHYSVMVEGERLRGSTGKTNKAEAQRELDKLLGKRARGEQIVAPSIGQPQKVTTVAGALDYYINDCCGDLKPKTVKNYAGHVEHHLKPALGDIPVKQLTADHIRLYRKKRAKEQAKSNLNFRLAKHVKDMSTANCAVGDDIRQSTINRELATLRAALNQLRKDRPAVLPFLPHFDMADESVFVRKGFIEEEDLKEKLVPNLPTHLRPLVVCAFYCGGRTSEWLGLDWQDVDFTEGLIRFDETKNKHPREVPIFEGYMRDTLEKYRSFHREYFPALDAVFTYDGRTRLRVFKRSWKTAMKTAGFPGLTPHDLRRSANRWMRNRGIPQGVRMAIMGHITPAMDNRYGIVDLADIRVAQQLGKG